MEDLHRASLRVFTTGRTLGVGLTFLMLFVGTCRRVYTTGRTLGVGLTFLMLFVGTCRIGR